MGFPYLQPIKNWLVQELEERENNPELESMKKPFIVLTSAATVAKSGTYEAAVKGSGGNAYYGCIMGNNPTAEKNYGFTDIKKAQDNSILGYDFTGKRIVTEGETGIRRPMPIINSLTIDSAGDNAALKTAQINVTCFTLKQLELFEIFFCRPGFNILIEFGNNYQINEGRKAQYKKFLGLGEGVAKQPSPQDALANQTKGGKELNTGKTTDLLIPKNNYNNFVENEFQKYFSVSNDDLATYYEKVATSKGNYEVFAGKVENFTLEIGEGGIYNITLTINAGNSVSLAIPQTVTNELTKIALQEQNPPKREEIIMRQIKNDLNTPKMVISPDDIKIHTFNFININDASKDNQANETRYITLHFFIKYLLNYVVDVTALPEKSYRFKLQKFKDGGKEIEGIPCNSKENIIASSDSVIYPGYLPNVLIGTDKEKKDNLRLVIDSKNKARDCKINGLEFNLKAGIDVEVINSNNTKSWITINPSENNKIGNAANLFLKYEEIVEMWKKSTTRAELINGVLKMINENSYGLYYLTIAPTHGDGGEMTIIDRKFNSIPDDQKSNLKNPTKIYRFKPNSIKSIVKNFTLALDMGNLVAGQTVFQTTNTVENLLKDAKNDPEKAIQSYNENNQKALKYKNGDGYYSVDGVEIYLTKKRIQEKSKDNLTQQEAKAQETVAENEKKSAEKPQDDSEIIDSKVIKFKIPNQPLSDKGKVSILILNDKENAHNALRIENKPNDTTTLSSLTANITIGGTSGFTSGEYFRINGIPETYNMNGVFQITNIRHSITPEGWDTEIEAMWLVFNNKDNE